MGAWASTSKVVTCKRRFKWGKEPANSEAEVHSGLIREWAAQFQAHIKEDALKAVLEELMVSTAPPARSASTSAPHAAQSLSQLSAQSSEAGVQELMGDTAQPAGLSSCCIMGTPAVSFSAPPASPSAPPSAPRMAASSAQHSAGSFGAAVQAAPSRAPPTCNCGHPAGIQTVKKQGNNKGRHFYVCNQGQCGNDGVPDFFQFDKAERRGADGMWHTPSGQDTTT